MHTPSFGLGHTPGPSGCSRQPNRVQVIERKKEKKMKSLSHVQLFVTLWTVARQASPSMGFSRQEYWSRLPFPSPGDIPDPEIKPVSPALAGRFFTTEPPEKHSCSCSWYYIFLLSLPIIYSLCLWSNLIAQVSSHGEMTQIFISENLDLMSVPLTGLSCCMYLFSGAREYQEVPKWITRVFHVFFVAPIV